MKLNEVTEDNFFQVPLIQRSHVMMHDEGEESVFFYNKDRDALVKAEVFQRVDYEGIFIDGARTPLEALEALREQVDERFEKYYSLCIQSDLYVARDEQTEFLFAYQ